MSSASIAGPTGISDQSPGPPVDLPEQPAVPVQVRFSPFLWLLAAILVVLSLARPVLGPFVVAGVIAYAFSPVVAAAQARTRLPRAAIVGIGYLIAILAIGLLVALLAERAAAELTSLAASGPDALATALQHIVGSDTLNLAGNQIKISDLSTSLQNQVSGLFSSPGDAIHLAAQVGDFALNAVLCLIVGFYLLVDGPRLVGRTMRRVPDARRDRLANVLGRIHLVLGKWMRGQLLLIALVAVVVYIGLGPVLHVPYALAIAILTGILEIIPLVGPLIATVIAGTDAFAQGGAGLALVVVVFFLVIRQIEDQVVMPVVIGRAVHLHPVVTIFAVLVGLSGFGILGGLLGVPVAAAVNVVFNEFFPAADLPDEAVAIPHPDASAIESAEAERLEAAADPKAEPEPGAR